MVDKENVSCNNSNVSYEASHLDSMSRKKLQALVKQYKVCKGNAKSVDMIEALKMYANENAPQAAPEAVRSVLSPLATKSASVSELTDKERQQEEMWRQMNLRREKELEEKERLKKVAEEAAANKAAEEEAARIRREQEQERQWAETEAQKSKEQKEADLRRAEEITKAQDAAKRHKVTNTPHTKKSSNLLSVGNIGPACRSTPSRVCGPSRIGTPGKTRAVGQFKDTPTKIPSKSNLTPRRRPAGTPKRETPRYLQGTACSSKKTKPRRSTLGGGMLPNLNTEDGADSNGDCKEQPSSIFTCTNDSDTNAGTDASDAQEADAKETAEQARLAAQKAEDQQRRAETAKRRAGYDPHASAAAAAGASTPSSKRRGGGAGGRTPHKDGGRHRRSTSAPTAAASNSSGDDVSEEADEIARANGGRVEARLVEMVLREVIDSKPGVRWNDIAGLEVAKQTLQEAVILPTMRPDIFTGLRAPPKGVLLFGPPGTGKTMLAKAVATESLATFFSISASSLTSRWVGEGEKMVRALFAVARFKSPAVVFVDEIDSLLSARSSNEHEASRRLKTEFLVQLDGAHNNNNSSGSGNGSGGGGSGSSSSGDERVLLMGATNRPQELDDAVLRRMVKRIHVPLPDPLSRRQLVAHLMGNSNRNSNSSDDSSDSSDSNDSSGHGGSSGGGDHSLTDPDMQKITAMTDGYSCSDLTALCKEAAYGPVRSMIAQLTSTNIQSINKDDIRPICLHDFEQALDVIRPSVGSETLQHYEKWSKQYGVNG